MKCRAAYRNYFISASVCWVSVAYRTFYCPVCCDVINTGIPRDRTVPTRTHRTPIGSTCKTTETRDMASEIVGGIEGGASHSTAVLMNSQGKVVAVAKGPGTNHHLIGMEECRKRIACLINLGKEQAGIGLDTPVGAIGLSLSGCELEETNQELVRGLAKSYPKLALQYAVGSDTEGSLATMSKNGGVVCIAGTGSNTLLINPDGSKFQCGGWGYLLGDEGSAWHIAFKAVKYCFDDLDRFETPPFPTEKVWELVKTFFQIQTQADLLASFYKDFDKSKISLMCKHLSLLARDGDPLAKDIFRQAGIDLAKAVTSVACKASPELISQEGGLHVVCVGSVWLSWDLLHCGFISTLQKNSQLDRLTLVKLKTELGVGAALMAADRLNLRVDRDYSKNCDSFYVYNRGKACNGHAK